MPIEVMPWLKPEMTQAKDAPLEVAIQPDVHKTLVCFRSPCGLPGKTQFPLEEGSVGAGNSDCCSGVARMLNLKLVTGTMHQIAAFRVMTRHT